MRKLTIIILSATLLLFGMANALFAGIETFYKGEWGMSPKEIQKLYGFEPFETYTDSETKNLTARYQTEIDGHLVQIAYTFSVALFSQKLEGVYFEFLFDNSRLSNLTLAELQNLTAGLMDIIDNAKPNFQHTGHSSLQWPLATWYSRNAWQSQTTVVEMSASYYDYGENGPNLSYLNFIFYNAKTGLAKERFTEAIQEIELLRAYDQPNK